MLLKQEGAPMFSVDLSTSEFSGHIVVALGGELDLVDAAGVAAALVAVAERDDFSVHASVKEAADSAGRSRRVVVPLRRPRRMRWPNTAMWLGGAILWTGAR